MNLITHVRSSRDLGNAARRARSIFDRFGLGTGRIANAITTYLEVTDRYGCVPTFPATAVLVARHPRVFQTLKDHGVELAIHGRVHGNYKLLSREEQLQHFGEAMEIFRSNGLPFTGFRSPYLNWNADTMSVLAELGFEYVSNRTMAWDVLPPAEAGAYTTQGLAAYQRVLDFYETCPSEEDISLPREVEGILDLPVAMPDDEATTDRLNVDSETKARIWVDILEKTYQTGELFVLNLHPERGVLCADPLEAILGAARSWKPGVWVAPMSDISRWWRAREETKAHVRRLEEGRYQVELEGDSRASLLVQNARPSGRSEPGVDGSARLLDRGSVIESELLPVVGVHPDCRSFIEPTLRQLGYAYEATETPGKHAVYFGTDSVPRNPREVMKAVSASGRPAVRVAPWPSGFGSALAITGDIDSVTLGDFFRRVLET
ncbi:MAG: polysaccharide deacetylase family protein [Chloroflexota bacterium]